MFKFISDNVRDLAEKKPVAVFDKNSIYLYFMRDGQLCTSKIVDNLSTHTIKNMSKTDLLSYSPDGDLYFFRGYLSKTIQSFFSKEEKKSYKDGLENKTKKCSDEFYEEVEVESDCELNSYENVERDYNNYVSNGIAIQEFTIEDLY